MTKKHYIILSIILIVAAFAAAFASYSAIPDTVACHWGLQGEANGYCSMFWGLFLLPLIMAGLFGLLTLVPYLDPKRKNIEKFKLVYQRFILAIEAFMLYLFSLTLAWNLSFTFDMNRWLIPAFGLLMIMSGDLIGKAQPNWTIGIRTPWTLSSETVWKKTHLFGGRLFKIAGLIAILGLVLPNYGFYLLIIPILGAAIISVVYSYLDFRKEKIEN